MSGVILNKSDSIDKLLSRITKEVEMEENISYASFGQRLTARLVDSAIVLIAAFVIQQIFIVLIKSDNTYNVEYILRNLDQAVPGFAIILWVLIYSPILENFGGTVGKRLVGIKLVDVKTLQPSAFRFYFGRTWLYLVMVVVAVVPAIVSGLAVLFSDKKQAWHDQLTGMVCIIKN